MEITYCHHRHHIKYDVDGWQQILLELGTDDGADERRYIRPKCLAYKPKQTVHEN